MDPFRVQRPSIVSGFHDGQIGLHSICALFLLLTGCGGPVSTPPNNATPDAKTPAIVFAAASTANALDEVVALFQRQSAFVVQPSYGGSSALAQQIAAGAAVDLFLSADTAWPDYLDQRQLVARRQSLLGNRLVIVVPRASALRIDSPGDLAADSRVKNIALADPESVPAGKYAKQALSKLELWENLKGKVVSASDVRQALTYVEMGAAEAGIVYATDAAASKAVRVAATIPAELTSPIEYPWVLLKRGQGNAAAESFYDFVATPAAMQVFAKHGFMAAASGAKAEENGAR
jgi:molybdate transport system substrate-binding protein